MTNISITTSIPIIIGLGNPGFSYHNTRHNIGFYFIDAIHEKYSLESWIYNKKYIVEYARGQYNEKEFLLLKYLGGINKSGEIFSFLKYNCMQKNSVSVIYDNKEKKFGTIGTRLEGSAQGHNGIKSLLHHSQGTPFLRIWFGIGKPYDPSKLSSFVLQSFTQKEQNIILNNENNYIQTILEYAHNFQ